MKRNEEYIPDLRLFGDFEWKLPGPDALAVQLQKLQLAGTVCLTSLASLNRKPGEADGDRNVEA